jgi:hypothetical protein
MSVGEKLELHNCWWVSNGAAPFEKSLIVP